MVAISGQFGAFNGLLQLRRAQLGQDQSIARLSNGERIQKAEDDPSGLAISNKLQSEVKTLKHLKRSHFEGVSAIQLADGNLEELTNMLTRAAELATQAASDVAWADGTAAPTAMNAEFRQIVQQIDQLNSGLRFNDVPLFGSSPASFSIPVDADPSGSSESITVNFSSFSSTALGISGSDLLSTANAGALLTVIDSVIENVSRKRGNLAAAQRRLQDNMDNLDTHMVELDRQNTAIRDTDIATETVNLSRYQILNRSNLAVISQTNLDPDRIFQLLK